MQQLREAFEDFHEAADPDGPGGGLAAGCVFCDLDEAHTLEGTIPDTFDFFLQDNFFLFGCNTSVELFSRIHLPTRAVRYMIVISFDDEMWQCVLDNCNPADGQPWPSSEDDDE